MAILILIVQNRIKIKFQQKELIGTELKLNQAKRIIWVQN